MAHITADEAADQTMERLGSEHDGPAYLSADIPFSDDDNNPIVSVIHIDDRRHWNLTVRTEPPAPGEIDEFVSISRLPDVLDTAGEGDFLLVIGPRGWWTLTVEILEPAAL